MLAILSRSVFNFLSHLCGGEVLVVYAVRQSLFLSHLCGGEAASTGGGSGDGFLSHLCGGEV